MLTEDDNEFDPTSLLEDEDNDEIEASEGEEGQDSSEGEEDESPDAGNDQEQDESEDLEERADGLEEEPRSNGDGRNSRERRSQSSWKRREEKFQAELEAERKAKAASDAKLQALEAERQAQEARRVQEVNNNREEMLSRMTPEERNAFEIQEMRAQIAYNNQMRELQTWDAQDKAKFESIANSDSELGRIYKKNAATIEKHLTDIRARNTNMPRDVLLRYELGDQVLKALANKKPSKSQPTRKVQKAPNSRGDASRTPARSNLPSDREARKKRLENVRL